MFAFENADFTISEKCADVIIVAFDHAEDIILWIFNTTSVEWNSDAWSPWIPQ